MILVLSRWNYILCMWNPHCGLSSWNLDYMLGFYFTMIIFHSLNWPVIVLRIEYAHYLIDYSHRYWISSINNLIPLDDFARLSFTDDNICYAYPFILWPCGLLFGTTKNCGENLNHFSYLQVLGWATFQT